MHRNMAMLPENNVPNSIRCTAQIRSPLRTWPNGAARVKEKLDSVAVRHVDQLAQSGFDERAKHFRAEE